MMISLFDKPSMPFYRFGDMIFIQKIETPAFEKYIQQSKVFIFVSGEFFGASFESYEKNLLINYVRLRF